MQRTEAVKRAVNFSRFIVLVGSFSSLLLALLLSISVAVRVVTLFASDFWSSLGSEEATKLLTVTAVEQADVILISAALLIIGIGLYVLFIEPMENLPQWLEISSVDDLKHSLVSVVVAVLGVNFFTRVVEWRGSSDILYLGGAIGFVVLSLAAFNHTQKGK